MSEQLLPCPFCGEAPEIVTSGTGIVTVYCTSPICYISPNVSGYHIDEAAILWNRRQPVESGQREPCDRELADALIDAAGEYAKTDQAFSHGQMSKAIHDADLAKLDAAENALLARLAGGQNS
jgi:hypothetical protein